MQEQVIQMYRLGLFCTALLSAIGQNAQDVAIEPEFNGYFPKQQVLATLLGLQYE